MRLYRVKLRADKGQKPSFVINAESEEKAISLVLKAEGAPRRAVISCTPYHGAATQFGVVAGRVVTKDGGAYVSIARPSELGSDERTRASACAADRLAHRIAFLLNKYGEHGEAPSYLDGSC